MNSAERIHSDYNMIREILDELSANCKELSANENLFSLIALAYSLSLFDNKYKNLNNHYYDLISYFLGIEYKSENRELLDLLNESIDNIKDNSDMINLFSRIEKLRIQLMDIHNDSCYIKDEYDNIKNMMIEKIMDFDSDFNLETATEIFNLFYSLILGGSLSIDGEKDGEKLSDRILSNLLIFNSTNREYNLSTNHNDYARYIIPRYLELAYDKFSKARPGLKNVLFYDVLNMHREESDVSSYLSDALPIKNHKLDKLFRAHDFLILNLNKIRLGKKISNFNLFSNDDYYIFRDLFPGMRDIFSRNDSEKDQIDNHLFDFLNRNIISKYKIDGAYTFKINDTDYKLFIVIRDRNTFNEMLGNLRTIMPIAKFNNISFTITPIFAPKIDNDDLYFELLKETLIDSDSIIYDKKRFLRKSLGKFKAESNDKTKPKQYVIGKN